MKARDVMSSPVNRLRPGAGVGQARKMLASHGFTALPVRDVEGRTVGIVTRPI